MTTNTSRINIYALGDGAGESWRIKPKTTSNIKEDYTLHECGCLTHFYEEVEVSNDYHIINEKSDYNHIRRCEDHKLAAKANEIATIAAKITEQGLGIPVPEIPEEMKIAEERLQQLANKKDMAIRRKLRRELKMYLASIGKMEYDPNHPTKRTAGSLQKGIQRSDLARVKECFQHGVDPMECLGYEPLFFSAIHKGNKEIIESCLKDGKADPNFDLQPWNCYTSLVKWARVGGDEEVLDLLLSYGASKGAHAAIRETIEEHDPGRAKMVVRKLLPYVEKTSALQAYILRAIKYDRDGLVPFLIEMGADVNGSHNGITPLMHAVFYGKIGTAKLLLEAGADPNACDPKGKPVITYLPDSSYLSSMKEPLFKCLLNYGLDKEVCQKYRKCLPGPRILGMIDQQGNRWAREVGPLDPAYFKN